MPTAGRWVACVIALAACVAPAPAAPHDRAYWEAIVDHDFAVPEGADPLELVLELSDLLGSPDSELRDTFGYGIPAAWIWRDRRIDPAGRRVLIERWTANLRRGIGESSTDATLLRSFSALDLSLLAALDDADPYLTREEFSGLLAAALAYLRDERDVRGWDPRVGWVHTTAHTADLLKFLARNRHLERGEQRAILDAVAAKLGAAGQVYVWGEDERLALTVASIVRREDFDAAAFDAWIAGLAGDAKRLWANPPGIDPDLFRAVENAKNVLKSLAIALAVQENPPPAVAAARDAVVRTVARM